MALSGEGRKYGLEIRHKQKRKPPTHAGKGKAAAIFASGADDEEDEEQGVEKDIARQAEKKRLQTETQKVHSAALAEDPTAFSYDDVYDDLHAQQQSSRVQEHVERKPKYISSLLAKAKAREQEREIVFERKLAKEREQEKEEFEDKEQFVTRAYREKLEERRKWLEEERRHDAAEAANDVTKKSDLSDLYRNLYRARTGDAAATPAAAKPSSSAKESVAREQESRQQDGHSRADGGGTRHLSSSAAVPLAQDSGDGTSMVRGKAGLHESRLTGEGNVEGEGFRGRVPHGRMLEEDHPEDEEGQHGAGGSTGVGPAAPPHLDAGVGVGKPGGVKDLTEDLSGKADGEVKEGEGAQAPRVTATVLSAAKERYLSRKKQRGDPKP